MSFRIILLAKQVPDTMNVGKDSMKEDGTVNRSVLPAIFNPDDLKALEFALTVKDRLKDVEVILFTMGPPRAAEIIREAMYRGADRGILMTDRKFAGSDTLATSYAIACALKKLKPFNLIVAGRQAIDGDTAQVGPQTAEKLGIPQVTYAEEIVSLTEAKIVIKRRLDRGVETVSAPFPVLITVHGSAPECRPRNSIRFMKYKHARTDSEMQTETRDYTNLATERPYLRIEEWSTADIEGIEFDKLGLGGSPTKVKKVENVVFQQKESKVFSSNDEDIEALMKDLMERHIIG